MILFTQNVAATSFFIHRAEILISSRDEIKRCIAAKKENLLEILEMLYCEYSCGNCIGVLGSKFYWHSVVGGVVNCTNVIYGARIHRTVALRMRLQSRTINDFFGVKNIC